MIHVLDSHHNVAAEAYATIDSYIDVKLIWERCGVCEMTNLAASTPIRCKTHLESPLMVAGASRVPLRKSPHPVVAIYL